MLFKLRKFEINSDKSALPFLSPMLNSVYLTLFRAVLVFWSPQVQLARKKPNSTIMQKVEVYVKIQFNFVEKIECGSVVYDTLTSPGYPNDYPPNMDCNYSVPIPLDMAMKLFFHEFDMEYDSKCE